MFYKKDGFKNFAKFTRKHICYQSLFLIKLQASPITPPGDCFCQLNLNEKKNWKWKTRACPEDSGVREPWEDIIYQINIAGKYKRFMLMKIYNRLLWEGPILYVKMIQTKLNA